MAGTSMVATTFVSDTPLVIAGWVRAHGIYQNWMWRCLAAGGLLTAFLFARYWRRGGVMTSAELAELRYGGSEARAPRCVQGVFQAGITTLLSLWAMPRPDPASLVAFYRRVRPIGRWGPVRALCPDVRRPREARAIFVGAGAGLATVYGALFALGGALLARPAAFVLGWAAVATAGAVAVVWALRNLRDSTDLGDDTAAVA
jgi:hypothetical protein